MNVNRFLVLACETAPFVFGLFLNRFLDSFMIFLLSFPEAGELP